VALAVVVPLVLPGLKEHGIFGKSPAPGHGGLNVPAPEPLVEMAHQLLGRSSQKVLTYTTNAADPPEQYLQVYVLNYDPSGADWTLTGRAPFTDVGPQELRPAPGLAPGTSVTTTNTKITMSQDSGYASQLSYLPMPYAPEFLSLPSSGWLETNDTLMVYGYKSDSGLTYSVTSKTAQASALPRATGIPADIRRAYLDYTGPDRGAMTRIARQVTAGSHTPLEAATDLQNYFSESGLFTYALRGRLPSTVYRFLTSDKRGYCQQFAFAMAVLARLLGIPSRIAVGYTAGTYAGHHTWKVTTADAHAWPELYFSGAGWLRFEPTPGGEAAHGTATQPDYSTSSPTSTNIGQSQTAPGPIPVVTPSQRASGPRLRPETVGDAPATGSGTGGRSDGFPVTLTIIVVLAALLIAPAAARQLTRRRRWLTAAGDAGRAHAAWRELSSDLIDHGLAGLRSESPRAAARRVTEAARLDEPARLAIGRIAGAEERARYARLPSPSGSLPADVQTVRRAIARSSSVPRRWRARLLPASTLAPVLAALRQVPDAFGWLDAAGLRIRRSLPGPHRPHRAAS
jgi:transglutaminase-like putative cysteine protease